MSLLLLTPEQKASKILLLANICLLSATVSTRENAGVTDVDVRRSLDLAPGKQELRHPLKCSFFVKRRHIMSLVGLARDW